MSRNEGSSEVALRPGILNESTASALHTKWKQFCFVNYKNHIIPKYLDRVQTLYTQVTTIRLSSTDLLCFYGRGCILIGTSACIYIGIFIPIFIHPPHLNKRLIVIDCGCGFRVIL